MVEDQSDIPLGKPARRWHVEIKGQEYPEWSKMVEFDRKEKNKADASAAAMKKSGYEARVTDVWSD